MIPANFQIILYPSKRVFNVCTVIKIFMQSHLKNFMNTHVKTNKRIKQANKLSFLQICKFIKIFD
jgi:hypothetical protein